MIPSVIDAAFPVSCTSLPPSLFRLSMKSDVVASSSCNATLSSAPVLVIVVMSERLSNSGPATLNPSDSQIISSPPSAIRSSTTLSAIVTASLTVNSVCDATAVIVRLLFVEIAVLLSASEIASVPVS